MRKPAKVPSIPAPGEGKRGEDGYLGYLLRQAAGAYRNRMDRALADLEVTPPQFVVMTMLNAYPGISNADIARLALLTPQTVSVIVANLERNGTIRRLPHSVHRRIVQLELTDEARFLLRLCQKRVQRLEHDIAGGLSGSDQAVVRQWLVSVAKVDP